MKNLLICLILISLACVATAKEVNLKWKNIPTAKEYFLEVSKSKSFDNLEVQQKVPTNFLKYELPSGTYYLRVQSVNEKNRRSPWSKSFKLTVKATTNPINVDEIAEKKPYAPIKLDEAEVTKFKTKNPLQIAWETVPEAKKYTVTLYRINDRSPAGEKTAIVTKVVSDPNTDFGQLPPGEYIANVSTTTDNISFPIVSEYKFEVQSNKPVEFEKIDLMFKYSVKSLKYNNTIISAGTSADTSSVGGEIGFEGTMWFSDTNFGLRANGGWGNLLIEDQFVSSNELSLSGIYRFPILREHFKTEFKPSLGLRAWTMPLLIKQNSNGSTNTQIFSPTYTGPLFGLEINHPFALKWGGIIRAQVSTPIFRSAFGNLDSSGALSTTVNPKVEAGLKYALQENYRLVAMAGFQHDEIAANSNTTSNGLFINGKTRVVTDSFVSTVGLEITDEGPTFETIQKGYSKKEKFSDFEFTAKYSASLINYSSNIQEARFNNNSSTNFNKSFSGQLELGFLGYFPNSHHGIRVMSGWGGYNYQNINVSYPEYIGQWAYQANLKKSKGLHFNNYLGVRSWQVPIIKTSNDGFLSSGPQLIGPMESAQLVYHFGSDLESRLTGDISTPLTATNQDSYLNKTLATDLSYKLELDVIKIFSEDFSGGLGLGYKLDAVRYNLKGFDDSSSTRASMASPLITVFGTYRF